MGKVRVIEPERSVQGVRTALGHPSSSPREQLVRDCQTILWLVYLPSTPVWGVDMSSIPSNEDATLAEFVDHPDARPSTILVNYESS